jgi:hypothetical protein
LTEVLGPLRTDAEPFLDLADAVLEIRAAKLR